MKVLIEAYGQDIHVVNPKGFLLTMEEFQVLEKQWTWKDKVHLLCQPPVIQIEREQFVLTDIQIKYIKEKYLVKGGQRENIGLLKWKQVYMVLREKRCTSYLFTIHIEMALLLSFISICFKWRKMHVFISN